MEPEQEKLDDPCPARRGSRGANFPLGLPGNSLRSGRAKENLERFGSGLEKFGDPLRKLGNILADSQVLLIC
jgi:hypothetical protein